MLERVRPYLDETDIVAWLTRHEVEIEQDIELIVTECGVDNIAPLIVAALIERACND